MEVDTLALKNEEIETNEETIKSTDLQKTWLLHSLLNFTCYFYKNMNGKLFKPAKHHIEICKALDEVIKGNITRLIINIAPRYGKTELAVKNFIAYGFAKNPRSKFLHLSYSDDLARDNSKDIQNILRNTKYQLFFDATIANESTKKWNTTQGGALYSVSSGGQVTGFGAGTMHDRKFEGAVIIDDPIKPMDALSETKRKAVNDNYVSTIKNRVNSVNTPIIIIMQRLHTNDLCGHLQDNETDKWTVLSFPCLSVDDEGNKKALWNSKHTVEMLEEMREKDGFIFETQYQQNPKPLSGLMYDREFKTYTNGSVPMHNTIKKCYIDSADIGSDYLCAIFYTECEGGNYIEDIVYTKKTMEYTENEVSLMLAKYKVKEAYIESNGAGRTFTRNVELNSRKLGNNYTTFIVFHQSKPKQVRIFTNSHEVMNLTYFPQDWNLLFPDFYNNITTYMKVGKNKHDDAADALTGTIERRKKIKKRRSIFGL